MSGTSISFLIIGIIIGITFGQILTIRNIIFSGNEIITFNSEIAGKAVPSKERSPIILVPTFTAELDFPLFKKHPIEVVKCVARGKFPILSHQTGMLRWVCNNKGEKKVTNAMLYVFHKHSDKLMLDVGANCGYYSLLAARLGHRAVQFDVQPVCQQILRNNAIINGFTDRVWTIASGVSDVAGTIMVPADGCGGTFPAKREETQVLPDVAMPLDLLAHFIDIDTEIMLMKVDTEGNEKRVLAGAMEFFAKQKIQNAIVEVTPGHEFWEKQGITKEEVLQTFREVASYGYWMISLEDFSIHRSPDEVVKYLSDPSLEQSDMWLTLDPDMLQVTGPKLDPTMLSLD